MTQLRASIRKHRHLAIVLLVLAFFIKAAIPAGMMVSITAEKVLAVTVCTGSGGVETIDIALPIEADKGAHHSGDAAKGDHCAFTGLAKAALGGADPILLAGALWFILVLALAPVRHPPLARIPYLLPPLRGPPAAA